MSNTNIQDSEVARIERINALVDRISNQLKPGSYSEVFIEELRNHLLNVHSSLQDILEQEWTQREECTRLESTGELKLPEIKNEGSYTKMINWYYEVIQGSKNQHSQAIKEIENSVLSCLKLGESFDSKGAP